MTTTKLQNSIDTIARRLVKIDRFASSPEERAGGSNPSPAGAWADAVGGAAGGDSRAGDTRGDVGDGVVADGWDEAVADAERGASNAQEGVPEPRNSDPEQGSGPSSEAEPGLPAPVP